MVVSRIPIQEWFQATGLAFFTVVVLAACGGGGSGDGRDTQPVLTSITVSPSELTLDALDASARLEATARDRNGNTLSTQFSWSSSDTEVVSVNADGQVTASGNGTATVTVRSGSVSGSATVTVEQAPASVKLSQDEVLLTALGAQTQLEASVLDANDNAMSAELAWESSDPAVASVDEAGKITAKANGTATVTAAVGSVSGSIIVAVRQTVASIVLVPEDITLTAIGQNAQLQVMAVDANGIPMAVNLGLTSSDPAVASVNTDAVVTARANGTAKITATVATQDRSLSASVAVTVVVRPPPLAPLTVTGDPNVHDPRTGRTPLHAAALANAPRLIAALVSAGADLEARDNDEMTPLHAAALANAPEAIVALLQAGADIEARNRFEGTPLMFATGRDSPAAVAALLEAGGDPNAHDEQGYTSLHWVGAPDPNSADPHEIHAATAILSALLEAGADPNARARGGFQRFRRRPLVVVNPDGGFTPLHRVVRSENPMVVRVLLEAGADPNSLDVTGHPALSYWAGVGGNSAILSALLEAGAKIQTRDIDGFTQLHLAAERDRPATVKALLKAGADLNARANDGRTAMHAAASSIESNQQGMAAAAAVIVLLEAGADPNAHDDSGFTALQLAPARSRGLLTALFDAHAGRRPMDPNARDAYGYTALHAAARTNSPELITALLDAGADIDALDNEGNTPLLLAAGPTRREGLNVPPPSFSPAAIDVLAAAGADLEARDKRGFTALHRAAIWGQTNTISALLEAGADPSARDSDGHNDGRTALQVALGEWAFDAGDRAAIVTLAEAEANLAGGNQREFATLVAQAVGNPAALAEARVNPNARDSRGRTVLHWLSDWDDSVAFPALAALLEAGADIDARDHDGRTPLFQAMVRRNAAMIVALAEAGADLEVPGTSGRTALVQAIIWKLPEMVAALVAAGADPETRGAFGWTVLQLAAHEGQPAMIAALIEAGADLDARDDRGRTALQFAAGRDDPGQWYGDRTSTPAAVAALVEAGADIDASDLSGATALHAGAVGGNRLATGMLAALGANWTSNPDDVLTELNARVVAVELFQGPMVWEWRPAGSETVDGGSGEGDESGTDHAKTLLHRATTMAVRIGTENPDPMPELSVSLSDAQGRTWAVQPVPVHDPRIVSVAGSSESGLWETEYVYELPAEWTDSGHQVSLAIDPRNRLVESDKNDNAAILTMDGYAVPVFDVTFVPIVFSGDPPAVDTAIYMAVVGDLLPIGKYRAKVGRTLDLSHRNLGSFDGQLSRNIALSELLHRWNAEAGENEYYHGLMSSADQSIVIGGFGVFGGTAQHGGKVAVSDAISGSCRVDRVFCGDGVHAHELGHNFGLVHLAGRCTGPGLVDHDFPYEEAGIGPRRGWVASRNEFVNPENANPHYDLMGYCTPRFVSDYNYNKMVDYRLGSVKAQPDDRERKGPSLEIGPTPSSASLVTPLSAPSPAYAAPPGVASPSGAPDPAVARTGTVNKAGPSLAFTGAVDALGLWSTYRIDASRQPPRAPSSSAEYFFTLWNAYQREIYREPMALLTSSHGETLQSWAVRVPVPEQSPAFLAILDASGTPMFIEPIDVSSAVGE